jgi:hypothetical protein
MALSDHVYPLVPAIRDSNTLMSVHLSDNEFTLVHKYAIETMMNIPSDQLITPPEKGIKVEEVDFIPKTPMLNAVTKHLYKEVTNFKKRSKQLNEELQREIE